MGESIAIIEPCPTYNFAKEYLKSKVVQPDLLIEDKYTIKGSKKTIEVLKLSAGTNSVSDISVYAPEDRFIFTGNTVFNGRFLRSGVEKAYEDDIDREDVRDLIDDKKFSFYKHFRAISKSNVTTYSDQLEWAE